MAESFLVAGLVTLLRRSGESFLGAAASSAVIWGLAHALFGALWFFGTVWAFFVFSCAYMAWRKVSFWHGYAAATAPHAAINLLAFAGKALLDGI